jgi:hypothetical protein
VFLLLLQETNRKTFSQHAATIVEVQPGELLAAWFGGSWERNHDVSIWVSKYQVCTSWGCSFSLCVSLVICLSNQCFPTLCSMGLGPRRHGRWCPRRTGRPHGIQCCSRYACLCIVGLHGHAQPSSISLLSQDSHLSRFHPRGK